jgi:hypothetical protein
LGSRRANFLRSCSDLVKLKNANACIRKWQHPAGVRPFPA